MTVDPYLDPATGVLVNRLGIAEPEHLQQVEADLTTAALADLGTRSQRAFLHQLSREAGWPLDWSMLDPAENEAASMASLRGENASLRAMLEKLVIH